MNRWTPFLATLSTALLLLPSVAFAEKNDCGDEMTRPVRVEKVRLGLREILHLPDAEWSTFPEGADWAVSITGVDPADFEHAKATLLELKELVDQGREGKIRGYGRYTAEDAALRAALWGILGATSGAGAFAAYVDRADVLLLRFLCGVAALGAYKTLRWLRTMDDALARRGVPDGQLWGALGPAQGPLQYWLKRYAFDGHLGLVLYLARKGAQALRIDFRGR